MAKQEVELVSCYNDIVLSDNRARTLTYGKSFEKETALEWLQSAIQTMTDNQVNFVSGDTADEKTLEIGLDFAYISHAATNKIGVVALTATKAGEEAHFRGNSSNMNWNNTKSEFSAALNRAVIKAFGNLTQSGAFCDTRPAIWGGSPPSPPD